MTAPAPPDAQLTHVGLYASDIDALAAFYQRFLGLVITDRGTASQGRKIVFMSRRADEHHQLVMLEYLPAEPRGQAARQLSFRVNDLAALKQFHALLADAQVPALEARDHGNSWSLYCRDPEDNVIEIYCATAWYVSQPWRAPLDLTQSEEAIVARTAQSMKDNPTSRPVAEWSAELAQRLARQPPAR